MDLTGTVTKAAKDIRIGDALIEKGDGALLFVKATALEKGFVVLTLTTLGVLQPAPLRLRPETRLVVIEEPEPDEITCGSCDGLMPTRTPDGLCPRCRDPFYGTRAWEESQADLALHNELFPEGYGR